MIDQKEFTLTPHRRGFHLITEEITRNLPPLPQTGILHLFIKHTSAALTINETADPDVQHAKSTIAGTGLTIPITNGRMNMGIWQGIYLCEFRNRGGGRRIVATVIG